MLRRLLPLTLLACNTAAWAAGGRPLTTDDAALTTARSCQVESFFQHSERDGQLWILPACNPTGAFEFTAGALFDAPADAANARQYTLQGKWAWPRDAAAQKSFASAGVSAGAFYLDQSHHGGSRWSSAFAYVPLTLNWTNATQTHFNLGWNRAFIGNHDDLTYAAAVTHDLSARYSVFLETFGIGSAPPSIQTGGSVTFLATSLQLDGSFGRLLDGGWRAAIFSIGLEWYPPALW